MKRTALALSLFAAMLTGCQLIGSEQGVVAFRLTNETDAAVDVVFLSADAPGEEEAIYRGLDRHSSVAIGDKFRGGACTAGVLIARREDGHEVARRKGLVCVPGEWVIGSAP